MKNLTSGLYLLPVVLLTASCQIYQQYTGDSVVFSDNYMVQYDQTTLSVTNTNFLFISPQNYTANSTIQLALILSNEMLVFATTTTIYILDPTSMNIQNSQPFLSDRAYLIPVWENSRLIIALQQTNVLYYLDPLQNGEIYLIYNQFNTLQTSISILGDSSILISDSSGFQIISTNGTLLYSNGSLQMIDGVVPTNYGVFALASYDLIEVFDSSTYNSMNLWFSDMVVYAMMPTADRFVVFTMDYEISVFSHTSSIPFSSRLANLGNISLDPSAIVESNTYINEGLIAITCSNSSILLFNISEESNFFYAEIAIPNQSWGLVSIMYLQDALFAVLAGQLVSIFDYNLKALVKTISLASLGNQSVPMEFLSYIGGSFFIPYMENYQTYYLSTCHYSCASCSGFGPNACTSCSSARVFQSNNSSCSCQDDDSTCPADQSPCFVCGSNYEVNLSSVSNSTNGSLFPPDFPGSSFNSSGTLSNQSSHQGQTISTKGTGQDATYIKFIVAPNAGQNATRQRIEVFMQGQTPIEYMLKEQGFNSEGKDSCSYISQMSSEEISTSFSSDPIFYSSMSLSERQPGPGPNYIFDLYGLRGTTQYELKICGGPESSNSSQTLFFTTKDNNFKVIKYQIMLDQPISQDLREDLLCFLSTFMNIPAPRIYSDDGSQCDQIYVGMTAPHDIWEDKNHYRRVLTDTSSGTVNVLIYGNPNTELSDTSADRAAAKLNASARSGLSFTDRNGSTVMIQNMIYAGEAGLGTPTFLDNIQIVTSSNTVQLSNVEVNGTSGYIYAMLSLDSSNQTLPTQEQIKAAAIAANGSNSVGNTSYYWYFNSDVPVSISFQGLSGDQGCTIYYFASNEDLTDYAKYTDVYFKVVQTSSPSNNVLLIVFIPLSALLFSICVIILVYWIIKRRRRRGADVYKSNTIEIKNAVRIAPQQSGEMRLEELRREKEGLGRMLVDLEKMNNSSILNVSGVDISATEAKEVVTPAELDDFKRKIKAIETKIDEFEQEKLCPICFDYPKDLLLGCGHLICSVKCGSFLVECPFDKTAIKSKKKIFQL